MSDLRSRQILRLFRCPYLGYYLPHFHNSCIEVLYHVIFVYRSSTAWLVLMPIFRRMNNYMTPAKDSPTLTRL